MAAIGADQRPRVWIRRMAPGKGIPQKARRETERSKLFLSYRGILRKCVLLLPPVLLQNPGALFLCLAGSEHLRGGVRGRWEQLPDPAVWPLGVTAVPRMPPRPGALEAASGSLSLVGCRNPLGPAKTLRGRQSPCPARTEGERSWGTPPGCRRLSPVQHQRELEVRDSFFRLACNRIFVR